MPSIVAGDSNLTQEHCCVTLSINIKLTVTCSSTHTQKAL